MRRHSERGEFDFMMVVWVALGAAVLYFGYMFIPPYYDNLDIKQTIREGANMGFKDSNDENIKNFIVKKASELGEHYEEEDGVYVRHHGTVIDPDNIDITREGGYITIRTHYSRIVYYPFSKKFRTLTFRHQAKESLAAVKW